MRSANALVRRPVARPGTQFGAHPQLGHRRSPVDDDRIGAAHVGVVEQHRLDLLGIHVDPADDEHVVGAAVQPGDAGPVAAIDAAVGDDA